MLRQKKFSFFLLFSTAPTYWNCQSHHVHNVSGFYSWQQQVAHLPSIIPHSSGQWTTCCQSHATTGLFVFLDSSTRIHMHWNLSECWWEVWQGWPKHTWWSGPAIWNQWMHTQMVVHCFPSQSEGEEDGYNAIQETRDFICAWPKWFKQNNCWWVLQLYACQIVITDDFYLVENDVSYNASRTIGKVDFCWHVHEHHYFHAHGRLCWASGKSAQVSIGLPPNTAAMWEAERLQGHAQWQCISFVWFCDSAISVPLHSKQCEHCFGKLLEWHYSKEGLWNQAWHIQGLWVQVSRSLQCHQICNPLFRINVRCSQTRSCILICSSSLMTVSNCSYRFLPMQHKLFGRFDWYNSLFELATGRNWWISPIKMTFNLPKGELASADSSVACTAPVTWERLVRRGVVIILISSIVNQMLPLIYFFRHTSTPLLGCVTHLSDQGVFTGNAAQLWSVWLSMMLAATPNIAMFMSNTKVPFSANICKIVLSKADFLVPPGQWMIINHWAGFPPFKCCSRWAFTMLWTIVCHVLRIGPLLQFTFGESSEEMTCTVGSKIGMSWPIDHACSDPLWKCVGVTVESSCTCVAKAIAFSQLSNWTRSCANAGWVGHW